MVDGLVQVAEQSRSRQRMGTRTEAWAGMAGEASGSCADAPPESRHAAERAGGGPCARAGVRQPRLPARPPRAGSPASAPPRAGSPAGWSSRTGSGGPSSSPAGSPSCSSWRCRCCTHPLALASWATCDLATALAGARRAMGLRRAAYGCSRDAIDRASAELMGDGGPSGRTDLAAGRLPATARAGRSCPKGGAVDWCWVTDLRRPDHRAGAPAVARPTVGHARSALV